MRAFHLKPTVSVNTRTALPQLVDALSGRTFPLSPTEASVVQGIGRGCTSESLLERLRNREVPIERRQLTVLLNRLAAAGFLEAEGVPTPHPVAAVVAPEDAVPRLRTDLVYKPAARAGLVEVRDLRAGRSFTLFEFEITIARMLDGRRTLQQVAAATERLGLKATLETLRNFIHQLEELGFLQASPEQVVAAATAEASPPSPAPSPSPGPSPAPASAPEAWLPELREMFNFALGHVRAHQYDEAVQYLEALLEIDGSLPEAKALLEDVKNRRDGVAGLDFVSLHGAPPPPPAIPPVVMPVARAAAPLKASHSVPAKGAAPKPPPPPRAAPEVHLVSESLPPLWTVSTVMKAMPDLPDVGDSVLAFDPSRRREAARPPPPARPKDKAGRK